MTLDRNSLLVRFAYSVFSSKEWHGNFFSRIPLRTTLCAFFWRAFVLVPLTWLCIGCGLAFFVTAAFRVAKEYWHLELMVAALAISLTPVIFIVIAVVHEYAENEEYVDNLFYRLENSVFVQGAKSVKSKFCPIIEFTKQPQP